MRFFYAAAVIGLLGVSYMFGVTGQPTAEAEASDERIRFQCTGFNSLFDVPSIAVGGDPRAAGLVFVSNVGSARSNVKVTFVKADGTQSDAPFTATVAPGKGARFFSENDPFRAEITADTAGVNVDAQTLKAVTNTLSANTLSERQVSCVKTSR